MKTTLRLMPNLYGRNKVTKINYTQKHFAAVTAIFLFGNSIISYPKSEGAEFAFFGCVLSCLLAIPVICFFINHGSKKSENINRHKCFLYFLIIFAFVSIYEVINDYTEFMCSVRMPNTDKLILGLIFAVLVYLLSNSKKNVIYLFSFFGFLTVFVSVVFLFVLSIKNFNFIFFDFPVIKDIPKVLKQAVGYIITSFGQIIFVFLFEKSNNKNIIKGSLCFSLILLLCLFSVTASIGSAFLPYVKYPYSETTAMISVGNSFNRFDGISYYIYFISSLLKAVVIIFAIKKSLKNADIKHSKIITPCLIFLPVLISCINSNKADLIIKRFLTLFEIAVLLILFLSKFIPVKNHAK